MSNNDTFGLSKSIIESLSKQLLSVADNVSGDIEKASDLIISNSGKVVICGLGKSGLIGQKIVATLCSTGTKAVFMLSLIHI